MGQAFSQVPDKLCLMLGFKFNLEDILLKLQLVRLFSFNGKCFIYSI